MKIRRLFCFVGFHRWTWILKQDENGRTEPIYLDAPPPNHAKCSFCNRRYRLSGQPCCEQFFCVRDGENCLERASSEFYKALLETPLFRFVIRILNWIHSKL